MEIIELVKEYGPIVLCSLGGLWLAKHGLKFLGKGISAINKKRMLSRWSNTPKDVVIVHRFPSAKTCPNASPFVVKLETFLRMAKIPYEVDENDSMSVKGKCPWITLNGEHVTDSQICIEFLAKKFDKRFGKYSEEERAIGTMARLMMDEHFYWGLLLWRYVYTKGRDCHKFFVYPKIVLDWLVPLLMTPHMKAACNAQGVGRHSQKEVIQIMSDDLRALSKLLGSKKFLLGSEATEDDAAVFGELAEIVWCCPDSPFEKLLNGELSNLKEYCFRMKETFWPDWDEWLAEGRNKTKKNN